MIIVNKKKTIPVKVPIPFDWLIGANVSGVSQYYVNQLPLNNGTNGFVPTQVDVDYLWNKGFNMVRFMVSQELLQTNKAGLANEPYQYFDTASWTLIKASIDRFIAKGFYVQISRHQGADAGFGTYLGKPFEAYGGNTSPYSIFLDFWRRIVEVYKDTPNVGYSLDNEPLLDSSGTYDWWKIAQDTINVIRDTGSGQAIFVNGVSYSGAQTWSSVPWHSVDPAATKRTNANAFLTLTDPCDNLVACVHSYFAASGSGADTDVVSATIGQDRLANVIAWSNANSKKVFIEEFGSKEGVANGNANNQNFINYCKSNALINGGNVLGMCWWTYAPYTPGWSSYQFTLTTQGAAPPGGTDSAQMTMLTAANYFVDPTPAPVFDPEDIPGLNFRYEIANAIGSSGTVNSIPNTAINAHANSTLTSRTDAGWSTKPLLITSEPTFGNQPVIKGNPAGDYASGMRTPAFAAYGVATQTWYQVIRRGANQTYIFRGNRTMTNADYQTNAPSLYSYFSAAATMDGTNSITATLPIDTTAIICVIYDGANSTIFINNGVGVNGNTGVAASITGFGIGNPQWSHHPDWYSGDIYGYAGRHGFEDRTAMINYLATKYGIAI